MIVRAWMIGLRERHRSPVWEGRDRELALRGETGEGTNKDIRTIPSPAYIFLLYLEMEQILRM